MAGLSWNNSTEQLWSNNTLSRKMRAMGQPMVRYRQFCDKDPQYGKRSGQTLLFNKKSNASGTAVGGRIIGIGQPIPRGNFSTTQGSCVAYPSGFAIPWDEEFETFSEFEVRDPISSTLTDDMVKALDWRAWDQFDDTDVAYTPRGAIDTPTYDWTVNGATPSNAATRDWQLWDYKNIIDALKKGVYGSNTSKQVPPWDGVNYICIGGVDALRALKDDPDWEKAQYYGDPEKLFSGETGRIYTGRCIEDNHLASTINGYKGEAVIFGADAVTECVATPEEIREGIPGDFGRDMALAWYYLGGFKCVWDYSSDADNRIVKIRGTAN